jgi:hypothetical protein
VCRINANGHEVDPLFTIDSWNQHQNVILENGQRTNNAQEGWHLAFAKRVNINRPVLSKSYFCLFFILVKYLRFIFALRDEDEFQSNRIRPYLLDPTRGLHQIKRSRKYIDNDAQIKTLVMNFDINHPDPNNINMNAILHHLRALQYRLAAGDIEIWE